MTGNSAERWGSVQIGLHWLIAVLLLVQLVAGWMMTDRQPGELQNFLYTLHKNLGLIVLILAVVRLGWRWANPVPELPADMPPWQVTSAKVTHFLLYLLLFLLPVTGFFYTALGGFPVPFLMIWNLEQLVPVNKDLGLWFKTAHLSLLWLLYLVLFLHIAGALQHHLVRKDAVLRRMMSSRDPLAS